VYNDEPANDHIHRKELQMNSTTTSTQNQTPTTNRTIGHNPTNNNGSSFEAGNGQTSGQPFWRTLKTYKLRHFAKAISQDGTCIDKLFPDQVEYFKAAVGSLKDSAKADTWKTLETNGHYGKNDKIGLVGTDVLVVGIDVASYKFNWRAFEKDGTEVTTKALENPMTREGIDNALEAMYELAVLYDKKRIIAAIEPTSHYWFNLYRELTDNGVTVIMVNPFAVNRSKEIDDNLWEKSDEKDPSVIAKLARDGAFSVPYLPEKDYAELRGWASLRERAVEAHTTAMNRLHRWLSIHFPEFESIYTDLGNSTMAFEILGRGLLPADLVKLGEEGILAIFKENKARGRRNEKAKQIFEAAKVSIGSREGAAAAAQEIKDLVADLRTQSARIAEYEEKMTEVCKKIYPHFSTVVEIGGISARTLASFLADTGDLSRFDSADELVKLSGLAPAVCKSGKYKGIPKISKRGRKRMRSALFIMAEKVVIYDIGFQAIYEYLKNREDNPLKYKQAMMNISTKLIRLIRHLLTTGEAYDPQKLVEQSKKMGKPAVKKDSAVQA